MDELIDALRCCTGSGCAEQRISELSLDCEMFQQKCMELDAQMKTVTDCHALEEGER